MSRERKFVVTVKADAMMHVGVVARNHAEAKAKARDLDYTPLTNWEPSYNSSIRAVWATPRDWAEGDD